jgi:hypothetical protein
MQHQTSIAVIHKKSVGDQGTGTYLTRCTKSEVYDYLSAEQKSPVYKK